MRREFMKIFSIAVVVLVAVPGSPLAAQGTFRWRFAPEVGTFVRWIYSTEGEYTFTGFPLIIDSTKAAVTSRAGLTRRIMERMDRVYLGLVTVDSVVARYRIEGRDWNPLVTERGPIGPAGFLIDDNGLYSQVAGTDDPELRAFLGVTGAMQVSLPPEPIRPGDRWETRIAYPYTTEIPADSSVIVMVTLEGEAAAVVDSLTFRGRDTLIHVSVSGAFQPTFVEGIHPANNSSTQVEFWGSHASSLTWSTGWNTWVTGSTRVRIHERIEAPAGSEVLDARVRADLSTRFRVIP